MEGHLSGDRLVALVFIISIIVVSSLFIAHQVESASQTSSSASINATVSTTVAITASPGITAGITFGSLAPNTANNNGTRNTDRFLNGTSYNITIDGTTDVTVNITQRLNASLTAGSNAINASNVTTKNNKTLFNGTVVQPGGSGAINLSSTTFADMTPDCVSLVANDACHLTFFLAVPANQPAGTYIANYCFCAYQFNDNTARTSCTCT